MCLQTTWKRPRIARSNMTVYKEIDTYIVEDVHKIVSPYMHMVYKLRKTYVTKLEVSKDNAPYDGTAWDNLQELKKKNQPFKSIGSGFHAAIMRERVPNKAAKCIIPKGARYYMDDAGLIVSNKIKLLEVL